MSVRQRRHPRRISADGVPFKLAGMSRTRETDADAAERKSAPSGPYGARSWHVRIMTLAVVNVSLERDTTHSQLAAEQYRSGK